MSVGLIVVVSGMAAYVLARSDNKWLQVVYLLIVAGFAVPTTAVLVPLFQMVSAAGFLNNHLAIVLPYAAYGVPFTTILFYAFFLDFPRELEEAARLDGCSRDADLLPRHRAAVGPGRGERRDLPGGVHLERVPARAADADAPGAEDPAGRHPATAGRVHIRLAGGDGRARHGDACRSSPVFIFSQKYFVRSLAGLGK